MNRRLIQLRSGPPAATLLRRIGGARPGTLAVLVEVWGVDEPRHRSAIEQRLAAGMASMFERRDGSLTARLRLSLIAGDRWLRRVIQQEAAAAGQAAAGPGLLGAGASLLVVSGEEAFLAQAGPAVAYGLDLSAPSSGATAVSRPGGPELARHPAVSPWLRRGVGALSDDALWPPLGMSGSGVLEVHFSHWAFPPGAAAILAPSSAAEILSRDVVRSLLLSDPAGLQRRLDELLPPELPLVCLAQARPPSLASPPQAAAVAEVDPVPGPARDETPLSSTARPVTAGPALSRPPTGMVGPEAGIDDDEPLDDAPGIDALDAEGPTPERWVRWIGPPEPSMPPAPSLDLTTRFDAIAFDTGLLDLPGGPDLQAHGGMGESTSPPPPASSSRASAEPSPAAFPVDRPPRTDPPHPGRFVRLAARVLLGLLPRRDGEQGEDGYALERARLGAALAVALPTAALLLTMLMRLRSFSNADAPLNPADTAVVVAGATAAEAPGILRLSDLLPVATLDGEADDPRQLVINGDVGYVFNSALQRVDWVNLITGEFRLALLQGQAVGQAPPVGEIESIALLPPPTTGPDTVKPAEVIALDAADRLWWLRPALVEALDRPAEPEWTTVDQLAGFEGRLYALDRSQGQIFRYEAIGGSFPRFSLPGDAWLKSTERLENAAEMQIDGAIYVRFVDGSLRKFVGGAAVPFALSGLPADGAAPILTAIGTGSGETLLAADRAAGRILALGPDGAWRATLLRAAQPLEGNPDGRFSALSGLAWDRATGRLFILEGRSLYKASLPKLP